MRVGSQLSSEANHGLQQTFRNVSNRLLNDLPNLQCRLRRHGWEKMCRISRNAVVIRSCQLFAITSENKFGFSRFLRPSSLNSSLDAPSVRRPTLQAQCTHHSATNSRRLPRRSNEAQHMAPTSQPNRLNILGLYIVNSAQSRLRLSQFVCVIAMCRQTQPVTVTFTLGQSHIQQFPGSWPGLSEFLSRGLRSVQVD